MKYDKAKIIEGNSYRVIDIQRMNETKAKDLEGRIFCPGDKCRAPLYMVHNPKHGGKTIFFRATNSEHIESCQYKNGNSLGGRGSGVSFNGVYTEGQINDYVRNLYKDLTTLTEEKNHTNNVNKKRKDANEVDENKTIIRGGRIISGTYNEEDGNRGRMSRRYSLSESDIGAQINLDKYGQIHVNFSEERYDNIEILIGQIYKNLNEQEFNYLFKLKSYVEKLNESGEKVYLVAGGLVTKYNNQLTVELQAKYSFRINGHTILDIIRDKY